MGQGLYSRIVEAKDTFSRTPSLIVMLLNIVTTLCAYYLPLSLDNKIIVFFVHFVHARHHVYHVLKLLTSLIFHFFESKQRD